MEIYADEILEGDALLEYGTAAGVRSYTAVDDQETFVIVDLGRDVLVLSAHEYVQIKPR